MAAVCAYSGAASATRPFTTAADVVTAVPYALAAALVVRAVVRRGPGRRAPVVSWPALLPWAAALGAFCLWELVTYVAGLGGDRHGFPTASSLFDLADRARPAKAAMFAAWLGLGWGLVRR